MTIHVYPPSTVRLTVTRSGRAPISLTVSPAVVPAADGGVTDHGQLTGRSDDDHPQYHTDARGDARYSPLGHTHDPAAPAAHAASHAAEGSDAITPDAIGAADADHTHALESLGAVATDDARLSDARAPTAHASDHVREGADVIDGDRLTLDYEPANYTPNASAPTAGHASDLAAHLAGIDTALAGAGGLPAVRALRAPSVANHLTIPDFTGGTTDLTLRILARLRRHTGSRQNLLFGDRGKLQIDDDNTRTIRWAVADASGSLISDQTFPVATDLSRWCLISLGRRSNGGTLEGFIGVNGWRAYYVGGGDGGAYSAGGVWHVGSGDAAGPAAQTDIAAVAAEVGTYASPESDLDLLEAAMAAGMLVDVGGALTHLWRASTDGDLETIIGAVDATLTGSALTVVTGAGRW